MPAMHGERARGRTSTEAATGGRRRRLRRVGVLLAAVLTAAVGASSAQADAVDEWNDVAATITMSPAPAGNGAPVPVAIFDLATVSAAMYDAANAIDRGYAPFRARPVVRGHASLDAAVATAARDTLVGLFPAFTTSVDLRYAASLAAIPDGRAKTRGIEVGQSVAATLLADRAGDGRGVDRPEYYVPLPAGAGVWVPDLRPRRLPLARARAAVHPRARRPVRARTAAGPEQRRVRRRVQRGEGLRPGGLRGADAGADQPRAVHDRAAAAPVEPPGAWPDRALRRGGRRPGAPLRDDERLRRRCRHQLLEREVRGTRRGVR